MKLLCLMLTFHVIASQDVKNMQAGISERGGSATKRGNRGLDGGNILPARFRRDQQQPDSSVKQTSIFAKQKVLRSRISTQGGKTEWTQAGFQENEEKIVNVQEPKDIWEINEKSSKENELTGDILPPKTQTKRSVRSLDNFPTLWTGYDIPIKYNQSLGLEAIWAIEYARVEYELRTCVCFSDYADDEDYIDIQKLDGCFSYVGRQGGQQTLSMGEDCETPAKAIHELFHALGVRHEQSRPDRDEHVEIKFDKIRPGKEHNFEKQNYYLVNKSLAAYDYESVMHYRGTAFSIDGNLTIKTLDPSYQDVIGQRRSFSPGDTSEINQVYLCDNPKRHSFTCNFEEQTVCSYTQTQNSSANWTRANLGESQSTPPFPQTDATFGLVGKGSFLAVTADNANLESTITSPLMTTNVQKQCLEFSYYMDADNATSFSLSVYVATVDEATGDIQDLGEAVTNLTTNQGMRWNIERLNINAFKNYKVVFKATLDGGVIAIDDINLLDRTCETSYFIIPEYSNLLNTSSKGESLYSPRLYTEDGYAFKIKVYPHGANSSDEDYMALYFILVQGIYDDQLKWPFEHRVIKLSVIDQNSNVLTRMNQNRNFLTNDNDRHWGNPTEKLYGWGYRNFMKIRDLTGTKDFMKHDSLMISTDVTDMTDWSGQSNFTRGIVRPSSSFKLDCKDNGHQLISTPPPATATRATTTPATTTSTTTPATTTSAITTSALTTTTPAIRAPPTATTTTSTTTTTSSQKRIGPSIAFLSLIVGINLYWM